MKICVAYSSRLAASYLAFRMFAPMTIHEALLQLRFQLFHIYDEREAGNIADLVMENITGWQKIDRVVNKNVPLSAIQENKLAASTKSLLDHKPLQYVLNEAWFYDMKLYVDENVLIPRPETEELVDWLVKEVLSSEFLVLSSFAQKKKMLDIGTGSGCIPLGLKKKLPTAEVHACDISEGALNVAKRNASDQKLTIDFHLLDILNETERNQLPVFDIIVSNPPYIPQKDKATMTDNVLKYEPSLALFVEDDDPLLFYKAIADFATTHLFKNGLIFLEIHEEMGEAVSGLFKQKGFGNIRLRKDLQGRDRMLRASS